MRETLLTGGGGLRLDFLREMERERRRKRPSVLQSEAPTEIVSVVLALSSELPRGY